MLRYEVQGKKEVNELFRQQNRQQKVVSESECLLVSFEDEQMALRKFLQDLKLKRKNQLVDLIHGVLFKKQIDKGDIIKHLGLFSKEKYIPHCEITSEGSNSQRIYLLSKGEVQISAL